MPVPTTEPRPLLATPARRVRRTARGLGVLAAGVLVLGGCGTGGGEGGEGGDPGGSGALRWPAASAPVDPGGAVWAAEGVVHLADGTTLEAGTAIETYVVAGDGAFVVPEGSQDLLRVTTDGAEPTGAYADPEALRASPDGRYLAFLDPVVGEDGGNDTPVMTAVVVDVLAGEEVVRTAEGMGDPTTDDLTDLYEDGPPSLLGIDTETAWFGTAGSADVLAVDLDEGDVSTVTDDGFGTGAPWYAPRVGDAIGGGLLSPDGSWSIEDRPPRDRFLATDGTVLVPSVPAPTWALVAWLDATTAVGFAVDAPPDAGALDGEADRSLVTCTVPDGACTPVPGATGPAGGLSLPASSLS